ncbi:hypothetical protein Hypma_010065 [Hypsizygus marmoreus]|uniref:Uncharacterized protein n=1 Tax=Hypsizygus marmoreus TaxID=39966 RepID=A0A369JN92_HYPMA|nr:hypothetical protein Hypma_010065 [Hypsizygus marmoreus]
MPFQTRNPYYLRISEKNVLPLYLYLDERHLDWMSDMVFQRVLADLRPHILPKLKAEASLLYASGASSKKPSVDTHRGETYQFCYFLRKTEPHSVVVKTRRFVAVPPQMRPEMPPPPVPSSSKPQRGKRKVKPGVSKSAGNGARKKRKTKGKGKASAEEEDLSSSGGEHNDDAIAGQPRRSTRATKVRVGGYQEIEDNDTQVSRPSDQADPTASVDEALDTMEVDTVDDPETQSHAPSTMVVDLELEEEEKPKPILQLRYQGFDIYGHCLCIVVEPWPPIRSMSRAPSIFARPANRAPSIAPPDFVPTRDPNARARTPLFLPDDDRERSETPAPLQGQRKYTPASSLLDPNFLEDSDDEDEGGMMAFSQVLNAAGDFRAGAADDDEDMDNAIFFGDADEVREL